MSSIKGARHILHIRCGDDIRDKLVEAGIEGDYLSFADPAWLGPPPAFNAWLAGRAALIAERTGLPRQKVRAELGEAYWRLARAPADYSHIVLWLEHDLYDQAALVRVLASFALRKTLPRIELICIDRFRGIKRFTGLGQLTPAQLASLWPKRKRVGRRQLALGARAWAALRALTPEPLEALLKSGTFSIGVPHSLEGLIDQLKAKGAPQKETPPADQKTGESSASAANTNQVVLDRLDHLEQQLTDMNARLRRIENSMTGGKSD